MQDDLPLFSADRLPRKPYCSNNKTASRILPLSQALTYSHIQYNPPHLINWLVFDLDFEKASVSLDRARYWYEDRLAPAPNIIVINPTNGHAQYFYALATPVARGENARQGPQDFARAVYRGLGAMLQSDPHFTQFIARNPAYLGHLTICPRNAPYELSELDEYIADRKAGTAWHRAAHASGRSVNDSGRNCTLFDRVRRWSYAWVAEYRDNASFDQFAVAVRAQAEAANEFPGHSDGDLKGREVRSIARSVAEWTWKYYSGMNSKSEDFRELQAARGRKVGEKKREVMLPVAVSLAAAGMSCRAIGRQLGVCHKTVAAWLVRAAVGQNGDVLQA